MADLFIASAEAQSPMFGVDLMEAICERDNLQAALKRVRQNRGSPGVDGMGVDALADHLRVHWPRIKQALLAGAYVPEPVKRVEIPKPGKRNEKRKLGIPCVLDRFIQQAMLQVLQSHWDATFSESSYGFRPGRSAHQAIAQAQSHIREGYGIVVDLDLEKFFDRVNHDRLMSQLAQEIADKRVLKLIRSYRQAGILENGLISIPTAGAPQGGLCEASHNRKGWLFSDTPAGHPRQCDHLLVDRDGESQWPRTVCLAALCTGTPAHGHCGGGP